MRKFISIILASVLLLSIIPVSAYGAVPDQITPLWDNAMSITADMTFGGTSGTRGEVLVTVTGHSGVSNITASAKLYYKNLSGGWTELKFNWNYDVDEIYLDIYETFVATRGYEYKLDIEITLTKNGIEETITDTVIATCPPRT